MIDETKETLSEISEEKLKEEDIDSIKEKVIETPTEKSLQDTKETNLKTTSKSTVAGNTRGNGTNPDEDPLQAAITASYKAEKRTRQFAENNFQLNAAIGSLNVITETGGMTYECTEHIIHGKNGFEYPIRRIYDTDLAKKDCPSMAELVREIEVKNSPDIAWLLDSMGCSMNIRKVCEDNRKDYKITRDKVKEMLIKKGDATLSIGAGWRLDLPYVDKDEALHLTGGRVFITENMKTIYYTPYATGYDKCDAWENHKGDDFTFLITRKITARDSRGAPISWKNISYELIQKDGTVCLFNGDGKLTKIHDPSKANEITVSYETDGRIKEITAPFGDKLKFTYSTIGKYVCPVISKISFVNAGGTETSSISYTYKKLTAEKGDLNPYPLLEKTTDKAGRTSSYTYQRCTSGNGLGIYAFYDNNMETNYIQGILYNLENYKTCSGNYKEIVGLETPELMTGITNALGFSQTIGYGKETISLVPSEAGSYTPTKKERVMVKSVVDINGSKTLGRYYSYTQKLHANFQIFVSAVTMTEKQRRTVTNYTEKKVEDRYIPHMSSRVLWIPLDKGSDLAVSSTSYQWDNDRISKETTTAGKNSCEISYSYDNWGNIKKETVTKKTVQRISERVAQSKYYNTDSGSISGFPSGVQSTPEQSVKGTRSLLVNQEVTYKTDSVMTCRIQKGYAYDKYGRCVWEGIYNGNHWGTTSYIYNDINASTGFKGGLVGYRKSPSGQAYTYSYAKNGNNLTTYESAMNVDTGSGSGRNITVTTVTDLQTGLVKSNTDGNGNTTSYTYDRIGRKTSETTPDGVKEIYVYNDTSRTITVKRKDSATTVERNRVIYSYDTRGNVTKVIKYNKTGLSGSATITEVFSYDADNNLISYIDGKNKTTEYQYDLLGRLLKQKNPDGTVKENIYNDTTNCVTVKDEDGYTNYEYQNFDGQIYRNEVFRGYPGGYERIVTAYEHDVEGRCIKKTKPNGYSTQKHYSSFGSLLSESGDTVILPKSEYPESQTPFHFINYNDLGLMENEGIGISFNPASVARAIRRTFNGLGFILNEERTFWCNGNYSTEKRTSVFEYDANGNITKKTDPDGKSISYIYNSMNRMESKTDGCGNKTLYIYDHDGNLIKKTDPCGFVFEYQYDGYGRLIKALLPLVSGTNGNSITSIEYDNNGNVEKITYPDGRTAEYKYDEMNRRTRETVTGTDGTKTVHSTGYTAAGRISSETDGGEINTNGTVTGGTKIQYEYDVLGLLKKKTFPDGRTEEYTYDSCENVTGITFADGSKKNYEYNLLGQLVKEEDEEGCITEYRQNRWGEETYRGCYKDKNSTEEQWSLTTSYNIYGEAVKETFGDGREYNSEYNGRGLMKKRTAPNGTVLTLAYDNCGRVLTESRSKSGSSQNRSYEYDANGFLKSGIDNDITTSFNLSGSTYNANAYGLMTGCKTTVSNKTLSSAFSYDEGKRLSGITYPDSELVVFGYNGIGLLKTVGNGIRATTYANSGLYDTAGHLISMKGGNSLIRTESWNVIKGVLDSYSWGINGKSENTLSWNTRGNITAQVKNAISYTYSYDKKNQLTEEKKGNSKLNTWTYDVAGNRKTEEKGSGTVKTVTSYTKSDLVKSDGTWNYNYDANGNMTAKGKNATAKSEGGLFEGWIFNATAGEVWKYEYDLCNRLVRVKHSNTGTNGLQQVAEYKYDFRDLMVCRTTGSSGSTVCEYFAYDSEGKLIYTEKGTEKHEYVYANGKLWCEVITKGSTKNTYYHHTDHLGTSVCITDYNGSILWQCEKDAFGYVRDKTNTLYDPNFTGKLLDANTGLYYFNVRWYDPEMGRFITEDLARDSKNWFVYCRNNPLKYIDPHGLFYYDGNGQQHSNSDYSGVTGNISQSSSNPNFNYSNTRNIQNEWNSEYIRGYSEYVGDRIKKYEKNNERFTCEDLVLSLLIDFAYENNLPVTIKNESGTYSSYDSEFKNVKDFKNKVLSTTGASDLVKNTIEIDVANLSEGDLICMDNGIPNGLMDNRYSHIQIIFVNHEEEFEIAQGNIISGSSKYNSFFYGGEPIRKGIYNCSSDIYINSMTGNKTENAKNVFGMNFRRWNFYGM